MPNAISSHGINRNIYRISKFLIIRNAIHQCITLQIPNEIYIFAASVFDNTRHRSVNCITVSIIYQHRIIRAIISIFHISASRQREIISELALRLIMQNRCHNVNIAVSNLHLPPKQITPTFCCINLAVPVSPQVYPSIYIYYTSKNVKKEHLFSNFCGPVQFARHFFKQYPPV